MSVLVSFCPTRGIDFIGVLGQASQMTPNLEEVLSTHVETKLVALEFCPGREFSRMIEKSFDFGTIPRFPTPAQPILALFS